MTWEPDLHARTNHWIFDFILSKDCFGTPLIERYSLTETHNYPQLPIINIYRVYRDKYNRHHYFSFSTFETIQEFCQYARIYHTQISRLQLNSQFSRCKVRKLSYGIHTPDILIYCLPIKLSSKRSQGT